MYRKTLEIRSWIYISQRPFCGIRGKGDFFREKLYPP